MNVFAQTLSPSDAQAWATALEKGGVIGVLVLGIIVVTTAIVRKWFVPGYVVTIYEKRIEQLEAREAQLLELALRGATISERAVTSLKQRG